MIIASVVLPKGEFQSRVFVKSTSEAAFVSNLLRHIRQDRIDLDAVAVNMHGPASPDKHKRVGEVHATSAGRNCFNNESSFNAPAPAASSGQSPEKCRAGKSQEEAAGSGNCFKPGEETERSPRQPELQQILEKELAAQPSSVPSSVTKEAVDKWLKKHQGQFVAKPTLLRNTWPMYALSCRHLKSPSKTSPKQL